MTVYADVLIILNLFINFFILQLTSKLCKDGYRLYRMIISSLIGALFSLYIFLPPAGFFSETLLKLSLSAVMVLVCFGFDSIKSLFRRVAVFFGATFLYAGLMLGIWQVLKPANMAINNGIIYLDISPTVLITATALSYIIISLIRRISTKQAIMGERFEIEITLNGKSVTTTALADTGNSLKDAVTGKPIVIIEQALASQLVEYIPSPEAVTAGVVPHESGFRMIPYSFVGGHSLLPAFKTSNIKITANGRLINFENILTAVTAEPLGEDYKAIIDPAMLN
ncbi:MAG: sigma-E processing peptidase SpoIIGA [Clostridia bacterium]|jgi:stage II sporulation protein GA (sporulation sigma-E factor processing peptidase)|nr:sigma-E processing peptidase SpoIIGA [Clostridia bacterium]